MRRAAVGEDVARDVAVDIDGIRSERAESDRRPFDAVEDIVGDGDLRAQGVQTDAEAESARIALEPVVVDRSAHARCDEDAVEIALDEVVRNLEAGDSHRGFHRGVRRYHRVEDRVGHGEVVGEHHDGVVAAERAEPAADEADPVDGHSRGRDRHHAAGAKIGGEIFVTAPDPAVPADRQYNANSDVTVLASGEIVITWDKVVQFDVDVYAQVLTPAGAKSGSEFRVHAHTSQHSRYPPSPPSPPAVTSSSGTRLSNMGAGSSGRPSTLSAPRPGICSG